MADASAGAGPAGAKGTAPASGPATPSARAGPAGSARSASRSLRRPLRGRLADRAYSTTLVVACALALGAIGYLFVKMAGRTGEIWSTFGVWGFLTGRDWIPTPAHGDPVFGVLPILYGTGVTAAIALLIAVPIAVGVALATTVFLPRRLRGPAATLVDLLAAVPSVVYGLWGVTFLVPTAKPALEWIADHSGGLGLLAGPVTAQSYLLSGVVLAVMVLPIISAITREVLLTVPADQREAALALGATRWEMVRMAMLPWARSGIVGASALGLGRAVGETIAIAMLLGNSPNLFGSLLGPGSTAASKIALETGEATGLQLSALTALAVVLFLLTLLINAAARALVRRSATGPGLLRRIARAPGRAARNALAPASAGSEGSGAPDPPPLEAGISRGRRIRSRLGEGAVWASLALALLPLGVVLGDMLVRGIGAISLDFFTQLPSTDPFSYGGGISNALVGTLIMMGIATAISAPIGVLVALFVAEGAGADGWRRRAAASVGFAVDLLLGAPSIVVGLTVYLGIVIAMGGFSALAGGIALGVIMFPIVVRTADEVLRLVPHATREAALALGAPRWRTTWSVVLPVAAPGIVTGVMLALARAGGETAPLLFTSLGNQFFSTDILKPIAALPQEIFNNTILIQTPATVQHAWGAALVLVGIVMALNLTGRFVTRRRRAALPV